MLYCMWLNDCALNSSEFECLSELRNYLLREKNDAKRYSSNNIAKATRACMRRIVFLNIAKGTER